LGRSLFDGFENCVADTVKALIDFVIPEPQRQEAGASKIGISLSVGRFPAVLAMLPAVYLNDHLPPKVYEIDDERSCLGLSSDMAAEFRVESPQMEPELHFMPCHVLAQLSRAGAEIVRGHEGRVSPMRQAANNPFRRFAPPPPNGRTVVDHRVIFAYVHCQNSHLAGRPLVRHLRTVSSQRGAMT
jgi:hypothetical protein